MSDIRMAMLGAQQIWYDASLGVDGESVLSYTSIGSIACVAASGKIVDSASGFLTAGLKAGQVITLSGPDAYANQGPFTIGVVAADYIIPPTSQTLIDETGAIGDWTVVVPPQGLLLGGASVTGDRTVILEKSNNFTAYFNQMVVCSGGLPFVVTLPNIGSDDVGRDVTVINTMESAIIIVDCYDTDTIYGEDDIECLPGATLSMRAVTATTWSLV